VDLLIGFTTILIVIGCGAVLAHAGVLDARSQRTLGEIAFFVASPALMVVVISEVEVGGAVANLGASATSLAVCFAAYAAFVRWRWRPDAGSLLIGALGAAAGRRLPRPPPGRTRDPGDADVVRRRAATVPLAR
jgi:malonate transporter